MQPCVLGANATPKSIVPWKKQAFYTVDMTGAVEGSTTSAVRTVLTLRFPQVSNGTHKSTLEI